MAIKNRVGKAVADDLDFKFDFDSYEDQFPDHWDTVSEEYSKAEASRSPITKARNNIVAGLKDGLMNRTGMEQVLKAAFPSEYGETYDNFTSVLSGVSESSDLVRKEFNRLKSRGKAYLRQLAPVGDMVGLSKLTDKLNDWGKEDYDNDTYGQSNIDKQREREDSIQASLGELFSIQNRMAEHRSKIAEAKENQKEAVETVRFEGQIKALASIDSSLRNQVSFQNKNTFNYYRKSIEIQLRKYHLLSDIYNTQTRTSEALIQTLNEIKLNTGLPEFVKMRNSEVAKEMMRSKAIEGIHKGIFGSGDFITKLTENLVGSVRNAIGSFTDFTDLLDPMVEQGISAIVDDDPLGRDALHSGVANVSPTLFGLLGRKILEKSNKTKFGRKVYKNAQRLKAFNDNLGENVLGAFKSGKIHQFGRKIDKEGTLSDAVVDFMQQLVYQSVNQRQGAQLDIEGYDNYGDQLGRDQLSSKAQRVVIPGYLARILRELTIIRTGQDAPLLEYNYRTNKFASSDSLTKDILRSAVGQKNVQSIRNLGTSALQTAGMFKTNKLTGQRELTDGFTNNDMLAIGNVLVNAASNNIAVDARFLSNPNSFREAIGPEKAEILASRYRKISREDKKENKQNRVRGFFGYEKDRLGSLGGSAKNVLKSMGIPENTLQAIVNAGHGGKLRQIGLIDGMGNVNTNKLIELSQSIDNYDDFLEVIGIDDEVGSLKRKRSKGMKGPKGPIGTSSYQVGDKVIIPGITPNRPQDMVSSQQGLAAYLADSSDTPYLEIISHQLSSLNETLSGSTGYVPEPRESALSSGLSKAFAWTKKFSSKWYGKAMDRFHQEWEGEHGKYIRDKAHELKVRGKAIKRKFDRKTVSAINKIKAKGKEIGDLYHNDYEEPILKARDFLAGKYRDAEGKVIESISDIKGHVFDEEGNVIVTKEDLLNTFYYDPKGKILESKHIKSLMDGFEDQKGKARSRWDKAKDGFRNKREEYSSKFRSFLNTAKSDLMGFSRNLNLPEPTTEQDHYLHTIARNTASTNDLLMEMSLKLENMQMMAINQFAMGDNLPDELRPRFMQRVKNLFNRNRTFHLPNQQKHIAQRIWEFGGWLGSSTTSMAMAMTRASGNLLGKGLKTGLSSATSLLGLGMDMGADFIGSLKGRAKVTSHRAQDLADANKHKVLDVYRKGDKEPLIRASEMKKGNYYDEDGNPVKQFVDIKGDLFDIDGNLVCSYDDFKNGYVKDGGTYKVVKAFNWFRDYTSTLATTVGSWGFQGLVLPIKIAKASLGAVHGVLRRQLKMQIKDIYVKGYPDKPVILARDLRQGKCFDKETGKVIHDISQISGPVVDSEGNEILTKEDLRLGLVDSHGKEFTDHYRNFSGTKQWLIAKSVGVGLDIAKGSVRLGIAGIRMGANMGRSMYNSAKAFLGLGFKAGTKGLRLMGGAYNSIYDKLTGKIKDPADALYAGLSMTNETNQYLYAIHTLLDQRMPLPNSRTFGDVDGDGLRENGIADIRQRNRLAKLKAAEEKALAKRDERLANMIGDRIKGKGKNKSKEEEKEEDSIFENLLEGLTEGIGMKILGALGLGSLFGGGGDDGSAADYLPDGPDGEKGKGKPGRKPKSRAARMRQAMSQKFRRSKAGKALNAAKLGIFAKGQQAMAAGRTALAPVARGAGMGLGMLKSGAGKGLALAGKGLSVAGKAIPYLGAGYAAYSGIENLSEGNYGAAAMDLGLGAVSVLGVGGTLSALGSVGGAVAAAGAALLPYALAVAGVALAGYVAYKGARKLYDMYKAGKVGDLEKARLMLYGFDHEKDNDWTEKILKFERYAMDAIVTGPNGFTLDPKKMDPEVAYDIFGFKEDDVMQSQKWVIWFNQRFIPAFSKSLNVLKQINPKYTIEDSYSLEGEQATKYLNTIKPGPNEYNAMYSPFKDLESLAVNGAQALEFINKVLEKVSKGESLGNDGFLKRTAKSVFNAVTLPARLTYKALKFGADMQQKIVKTVLKTGDKFLSSKIMSWTPVGMAYTGIKSLLGFKGPVVATNGNSVVGEDGKYDPFLSIKYKAYGLSNLNDTTRISILNQVEKIVAEDITWSSGVATYAKDIAELVESTYSLFGIDKNDKSGIEILGRYFKYRFLPIFVNLITATNKHLNTTDLNRIAKARPAIKMLIVNDIVNIPVMMDETKMTTWDFSLSPFGTILNTNKSTIDGDLDKLKKEVDAKGQSDAKVKAEEAANQSKSLGDRIRDFGKTLFKATPFGFMADMMSKLLPDSFKDKVSEVANNVGEKVSDTFSNAIGWASNTFLGKVTGTQEEMGLALYSAFRKSGFSDAQSRVLTAEVGRENAWRPDIIFGTHIDPANGATNAGMISWQGGRVKPLLAVLQAKGLLQNGKMVRSPEALQAQTDFIMQEMRSKSFGASASNSAAVDRFLNNPNIGMQEGMDLVGQHYIKWAINNPKYRAGGIKNRNMFLDKLNQSLGKPEIVQKINAANNTVGVTTRADWNNQAGVNTRADWNRMNQSPTQAPSKEYMMGMKVFSNARQHVMNNKSLTDIQRKKALADIDKSAHQFMEQNGPRDVQYNYDTSYMPNTGTKVNAKTKPGMVAAWCARNGANAHTILGKKKGGNCAATVGLGLYHAGYIKTPRGNGHAYSYGQKLLNLGWKEVTGQAYQVGDIAVCYPNPRAASSGGRKYGHVSVFNGSVWWADIPCHSPCPYRDRNTAGYTVKVYRDGNYMNGGTEVDASQGTGGGFAGSVAATAGVAKPAGFTTTVNGKLTKEQIEKGKVYAQFGITESGISAASKLYNYTTPEKEAVKYNYDTSITVSDKTDGKSKTGKAKNKHVDPKKISTDSKITTTKDSKDHANAIAKLTGTVDPSQAFGKSDSIVNVLKDSGLSSAAKLSSRSDVSSALNGNSVDSNGEPNDALARLQASVRRLLGIGKVDASSVNAALASTQDKREEMQKEQKGTSLLSMALDKAKRAVVANTDKNNLKESTKAAVEQSKAMKNDIVSVSNEILKENKEQTKLLTDILATLRKEKVKGKENSNSFTHQERMGFKQLANGSSDLKTPSGLSKPVINMSK
nr:MAG TPA: putative cytoplasmic protein [Caudoviricetes sp.]